MNTTQGKIEIYDENSSKGLALRKQMEAGEDMMKRTLAKRFSQMNGEDFDDL